MIYLWHVGIRRKDRFAINGLWRQCTKVHGMLEKEYFYVFAACYSKSRSSFVNYIRTFRNDVKLQVKRFPKILFYVFIIVKQTNVAVTLYFWIAFFFQKSWSQLKIQKGDVQKISYWGTTSIGLHHTNSVPQAVWLPEFVNPGSCGKWPCCISAKISVVLKFYRGLGRLSRSVTRRNLEQSTAASSRTVILFMRFFPSNWTPC
jgi:hypothetical protein